MNPFRQTIAITKIYQTASRLETSFCYAWLASLADDFDANPTDNTYADPITETLYRLRSYDGAALKHLASLCAGAKS